MDALESINADVVRDHIFPVIIEESNMPLNNSADENLVGKLKEIFRKYKESLYRISRGSYIGKIGKSKYIDLILQEIFFVGMKSSKKVIGMFRF